MPIDFIQFGDGWVKEMMQFTKPQLINKLKEAYIKVDKLTSTDKQSTSASQIADKISNILSNANLFNLKVCFDKIHKLCRQLRLDSF